MMELCTVRGISNLPQVHRKLLSPRHMQSQSLILCKTHVFHLRKQTRFNFGLQHHSNSSLRSTTSDEISTDTTGALRNVKDEPKYDSPVTVEDTQPLEKKEKYDSPLNEAQQEDSLSDNLQLLFKFLEDLNIKFDYEDPYSILVFGGGGAVALWLLSAIVGAIDSIPVFPQVLELVGLGYTLWFSSRYLIFKKNRDELVAKIEQIKQQVLGSEND